eukprot:TRINITY_DN606_c0_g2_i1.p2 TRINITY_DN606_c0_g2~~TRINITY_DN606_c0_g2_i1.p2  ORF type:complete len:520 (+),score=274.82 TRINITY_DN606_c0_g2_i1:102-1562(+)
MHKAAVALALVAGVVAEIPPSEYNDYVRVATDSNWRETVEKEELILVEFYAPWCGACKQMQPYYDEAAKILSELDKPIPLAKLDAIDNTAQAGKAGLTGYPTLRLFRHGVMSDYTGSMSRVDGLQNEIVEYMQNQVGLSSTVIASAKDLKTKFHKKNLDHVAVVGYFASNTGVDYKIFMQVADTYRGKFQFFHVDDPKVLEDVGYYSSAGAVTVYRPWGGKQFKVMYKGAIYKKTLSEFVVDSVLPPVGFTNHDILPIYQGRKKPILRAIVSPDDREEREAGLVDQLKPIQKKHAKALQFVIMEETKDYGHAEDDLKKGIFLIEDGKKKYQWDEEEDGALEEWVQKFTEKKLSPHVKSEKPAPKAAAGKVQVVVGKSFDRIVMDTTKDVLLEAYAPWCGHCKRLEPVYNDLAKAFKNSKNLVIAKIDSTANEVSNKAYKAGGFPTILFAPANDKANPIKYEGQRELEDMVDWIKQKATVQLEEEEL